MVILVRLFVEGRWLVVERWKPSGTSRCSKGLRPVGMVANEKEKKNVIMNTDKSKHTEIQKHVDYPVQ